MYDVKILADSISPLGVRLTTFETTFPRFILAEWNTHRKLSRNSASSRAIPTEKQIEAVKNSPFVPQFNKRVTGMGVGEPLDSQDQLEAETQWLKASYAAVEFATELLHVDKSRANRLLEPFMWHTAITTATSFSNFFALRDSEFAQPEFQTIASMMRLAYDSSEPIQLAVGDLHLPLVYPEDKAVLPGEDWAKLSSGRCARVSYDRHHDAESHEESIKRHNKLTHSGHWSPTEHQGLVMASAEEAAAFNGNFDGDWGQFRKTFIHEDDYSKVL